MAEAIVYLISQQNLSARRQRLLEAHLAELTPLPSRLVRLEGVGTNLAEALDAMRDAGWREISVQPLGFPLSESLTAWLPGVLAHWLAQQGEGHGMVLRLGADQCDERPVLAEVAAQAMRNAASAPAVEGVKPSLGKPGWQHPPPFVHHILVCTGPRCHFHGARSLRAALAEELARQDLSKLCLIAQTGCLYPCNQGPLLAIYPAGEWYRLADETAVADFVTQVVGEGRTLSEHLIHRVEQRPALSQSVPETT
ncbi:(2Fe-2S) ferredoxin domain-containing protein [Devosia geojensis]|uniref:(2Fe-2S) ferredoxin domain-containing protein n=1 Tax=Devosia geojensis TaxID=443610 RepID=UPI000696B3C7|nr:(2Fe-2S) ferredoxin domain-containing protein [Devosia geojensis]